MSVRTTFLPLVAGALVAFLSAEGGCGGGGTSAGLGGAGGSDTSGGASSGGSGGFSTTPVGDSGEDASSCANGQIGCYVPPNCTTTLSGTVYDPAGKNPIYNAIVFVPNSAQGTLPKVTPGTNSCNTCDVSIGNYVAAATTDYKGHFTLTGVPAMTKEPFVVQIGKWRREVFLPEVKACQDNVVAAADSRLPAKKSEGDMPQMALLTGGADNLGCFLAGLGIDPSEWTGPKGGGRLDVYQGVGGAGVTGGTAGSCTGSGCPLWSTMPDLEYYDIALLACEAAVHDETKGAPAMENMHTWLDEGGKVFATHYHYTWFKDGPTYGCANCTDFVGTASWLGSSPGSQTGNFTIDTSFPKGKVLQQWLANLGLATGNTIALNGVASSVGAISTSVPPPATRWIYDPSNNQTKYMTILTPVGGAPKKADAGAESSSPQYCGKAVFSDLHAGGSAGGGGFGGIFGGGGGSVPGSCPAASLTAQEAALEFLFFDLSACVSDESQPPPMIPPSTAQ